ncbi:MAG: GFA family protein [Acidiferrobacterales bacterium]|nr:GFA family protein [Acidiferrobacterales bacterium]
MTYVFICHCSICRKSTGSGGIAVCVINNDDFQWVSGKESIDTWHKPNHDWQTSFCKKCGSPLPGKNNEAATYIPVGLLDGGHEKLSVKHHLFVDSKGPWEKIKDDGVQHQKNFDAKNT